ncbi:MAG: hypothetical protein AB7N73_15815 [Gemmatimonadales bacterium]
MAGREAQLEIWQRVRAYLEDDRGLGMAQVSRDTGLPYPTINRWWSEQRLPDPAGLQALIVVYGLNGHWVMTGEGNPDVAVQQAVEKVDVIDSLAYQAGGRAALGMMAEAVERALAESKRDWSTPKAPDPETIRSAAKRVSDHLGREAAKKTRRTG